MTDKIILFPEYERLKSEVELLRTELSMLVLERDELLYVECKNIEMIYMLELGSLEYKAYEAQCAYLRLKRKAELIQAKINRQEKIDLEAIDNILDIEFAEYRKKLEELIDKMNKAIDRNNGRLLSKEEASELKKLYRHIVKALHPDLHPNIGEEKIKLFVQAVKAYENADLNTMRIIAAMISDDALYDTHEDALQALLKEKNRLNDLIEDIKESIQSIKNDYPYTLKGLISDKKKTSERKNELISIIEQYKSAIAAYKTHIKEMVG